MSTNHARRRPNRKTTLRNAYNKYRDEIEDLIPFDKGNLDQEQRYQFLKEKLDQIEIEANIMHGFSTMREYEEAHPDCKIKCYKPKTPDTIKDLCKAMEKIYI